MWPDAPGHSEVVLGLATHIDGCRLGLEVSLDAEGMGAWLRGSPVSPTLLSEARDIGAEVPGFVAAKLHVGHVSD